MLTLIRYSTLSLALLALTQGCRSNDKNSSTSNTFSCSVTKEGAVAICTQYQELTGTTLTGIQSECELRSAEGYAWAVAACPASTLGTCALPATNQKPATSTQFYYGAAFGGGTAEQMCTAQSGTFKAAS